MDIQAFSEGAFLRVLLTERHKSACKDKHVAAALTTGDYTAPVPTIFVHSLAHNVPQNDLCKVECPKLKGEPCQALHAEVAAIKQYPGATGLHDMSAAMWVTHWPCINCLQAIRRTGVQNLYIVRPKGFEKEFIQWILKFAQPVLQVKEHTPEITWTPTPVRRAQGLEYTVNTTGCTVMGLNIRVFSYEDTKEDWESVLRRMREYRIRLGDPDPNGDKMSQVREIILSLHQEVAELCNTVQWKPWKKGSGVCDEWALEEASDILFFLDSWLMVHNKTWTDLLEATNRKITENHNRINNNRVIAKKDKQ